MALRTELEPTIAVLCEDMAALFTLELCHEYIVTQKYALCLRGGSLRAVRTTDPDFGFGSAYIKRRLVGVPTRYPHAVGYIRCKAVPSVLVLSFIVPILSTTNHLKEIVMPNISQAQLDEAVATAVAAALATQHDKRDENRGALWFAKEDSKAALSGEAHIVCPACSANTLHKVCLYTAGGDGTNKLPVYRSSFFIPKDK